ncbi:hypothetical protein BJ878DRAFT_539089 [Calycina marina]|uniref:Uncharacterized protein n=1 Tax=Calycina marina TaxID=1763456 RepID=A0A9P7Z9Y1_9HELO|nr:hypothetical protein BJ878DRAFT_539089 [Calycina marina]
MGESFQPWALNLPPEFLNYVEQVAEPVINQDGYDKLLRDMKQRKLLVKVVIMRALGYKVFRAKLLGADETEEVRTIMGSGLVTKYFHFEVAKLTAQISLMLHSLSKFLYGFPPTLNPDDPEKPSHIREDASGTRRSFKTDQACKHAPSDGEDRVHVQHLPFQAGRPRRR